MPAKKWKTIKYKPTVESPTWGDLHQLAETVLRELGGPSGAAQKLNARSFYALSILASLNLDEKKSKAFILGTQYLS
jgi:hypothetical protein